MGCSWETAHVQADLRQKLFGGAPAHAGNGFDPLDGILTGLHAVGYLPVHDGNTVTQEVQMSQETREENALVSSHHPSQGLL